jgi:hypothetical protein
MIVMPTGLTREKIQDIELDDRVLREPCEYAAPTIAYGLKVAGRWQQFNLHVGKVYSGASACQSIKKKRFETV